MDAIDPERMARALGEIPLFREFQRILRSGAPGAANWEIGTQIALAIAGAGLEAGPSPEKEEEGLREACRLAELEIVGRAGLEPPHVLAKVSLVDRQQWARIYLGRFQALIDRLTMALRRQLGLPFPVQGMERFLDALGSFAMGAQVGFLVGHLSYEVISQYDLWLPSKMDEHIFVVPNARLVAAELQADPEQFWFWLALHEVSRQMELDNVGWARGHLTRLIESYVDAAEINVMGAMEQFQALQDPEELGRLIENPQNLLPIAGQGEQLAIGEQIQSLIAVLEGYGDWLMHMAAGRMLPEYDKIAEGMIRRRVERSSASQMLEKLLGIALKHEHYRAGRRFVDSVAKAGRLDSLFVSPATLPTLEEVQEPAEWLKRVAFS